MTYTPIRRHATAEDFSRWEEMAESMTDSALWYAARDCRKVEAIWRELYMGNVADGRGGAQVLAQSAVDVALWDIVGKAQGKPVYELLGGHAKPIDLYCSTGEQRPAELRHFQV